MRAYIPLNRHPEEAKKAIDIAKKYGIEVVDDVLTAELMVSVGGDGSVLHWYRKTLNEYEMCKPILPVKSLDSLCYVSDFGMSRIDEAFRKLSKRLYRIEKRAVLDFYKNSQKFNFALYDITIMQIPKEAMRCMIRIDGEQWFDYKIITGDGFTVATPSGSTGYTRSAMGYMLDPSDPVQSKQFVLTLRYPVYLRSEEVRSKVIPDSSAIDFKFSRPDKAFVATDNEYFMIDKSDKITIKKSDDKTFDLVRIKGMEEDRESKEKRRIEFFEDILFEKE